MSAPTRLYSVFHLNAAFSCIEEEDRPQLLERCYWPLLRLAREPGVALAIEATAYTLEALEALDPTWIADLRDLVESGTVELVASGHAQVIGPLCPPELTLANLSAGLEAYERLLRARPRLALVNEQAFSAGLVPLYREAGFAGLLMDWADPASHHPEWDPSLAHTPQRAAGSDGEAIPLLWIDAMAFQKFQRYAHGELERDPYLEFLARFPAAGAAALALYANDAEVFDYRPGRYRSEAALSEGSEWERIRLLYATLAADPRFELAHPSTVLEQTPPQGDSLQLGSAGHPVPVKKQRKYNVARWSVSGRDDVTVNTACWRVFEGFQRGEPTPEDWKALCEAWGSDYRTHITERRWAAYRARLDALLSRWATAPATPAPLEAGTPAGFQVERQGLFLQITSPAASLRLNVRRGLAIDAFRPAGESESWVGTLPHGYYSDIAWGADFYTGHLTLDVPGEPKVTDLSSVEPEVSTAPDGSLVVSARIETRLGALRKRVALAADATELRVSYDLGELQDSGGALRLGHVTLNPALFERGSLAYATHNGGRELEVFSLAEAEVDQGAAVSSLVSSTGGVGMTGGEIRLRDGAREVTISCPRAEAATLGLLTCRTVRYTYFCRASLSLTEHDDTRRPNLSSPRETRWLSVRIALGNISA